MSRDKIFIARQSPPSRSANRRKTKRMAGVDQAKHPIAVFCRRNGVFLDYPDPPGIGPGILFGISAISHARPAKEKCQRTRPERGERQNSDNGAAAVNFSGSNLHVPTSFRRSGTILTQSGIKTTSFPKIYQKPPVPRKGTGGETHIRFDKKRHDIVAMPNRKRGGWKDVVT